jgi:glycosyltransferase involved in cell wall biosynthesis
MTRKRVLLLGPLPPPHMGPSVATEVILKSRLRDRYALAHLDTTVHSSLTELGKVRPGALWRQLRSYGNLTFRLLENRPDLLIVPVSQTTPGFVKDSLYVLIARLLKCRVLLQLRGSNFRNWLNASSLQTRAYVRLTLKSAQGMAVLGERNRTLFSGLIDDDRIHVFYNGADYPPPPAARQTAGAECSILYLGSLQESKGIDDLVEAAALLKSSRGSSGWRITAVGTWRDRAVRDRCLRRAHEEDLPVSFQEAATGEEKLHRYAAADLFVFPPRQPEGHPWVIVEAMAHGLPIVSTDQGAIPEAVIDGKNGFIVPPRAPGRIARAVEMFLDDPELGPAMGKAGLGLYRERFTEEKMCDLLSLAIERTLAS